MRSSEYQFFATASNSNQFFRIFKANKKISAFFKKIFFILHDVVVRMKSEEKNKASRVRLETQLFQMF